MEAINILYDKAALQHCNIKISPIISFGKYKNKYTWEEVCKWDFSYIKWLVEKSDYILENLEEVYEKIGHPIVRSIPFADSKCSIPYEIECIPFEFSGNYFISNMQYFNLFRNEEGCSSAFECFGTLFFIRLQELDISSFLKNSTNIFAERRQDWKDEIEESNRGYYDEEDYLNDAFGGDPDGYWNID